MNISREGRWAVVYLGELRFTLDVERGNIVDLTVGPKKIIKDNAVPPIFATLMESAEYDGTRDVVPREFIHGNYSFKGLTINADDHEFTAAGRGEIAFPGGDTLEFALEYHAETAANHLSSSVSFVKQGTFTNRSIREAGFRQPLALAFRKRVVQAGDQGLRWDTRHFYQFHTTMSGDKLLGEPDTNWWRHFYVEQETEHCYRVWRAESKSTAGLKAFIGRRAAGWMTAYDREGGALMAYRGIAERAPKSLYVNADNGGEGIIYFHSPTQPAASLHDPRIAASLFDGPHKMDWIFFAGEEAKVQPDAMLAKLWGVDSLPSDGPTHFEPIADDIDLWNAPTAEGALSPMVAGGLPIPRGAMTTADQARLFRGDDEVPCQGKAIAFWPDGSVKWLLLIFPLDGGNDIELSGGAGGDSDEMSFKVTLRKGGPAIYRLMYGKDVRAGKITGSLVQSCSKFSATVDTGPLKVMLEEGFRWMPSVKLNRREMLRDDGEAQAAVDFVRMAGKEAYPVGTTHPDAIADPGPVRVERIEVEDSGPLRAVIRLEGHAMCQESPRVVMRLEFYRGRSTVRLTHSVEFMQKDPREVFARKLSIRIPLAVDADAARVAAGGQDGPVMIGAGSKAGLRQTNHLNYEIWRSAESGPYRNIVESRHASRGWLDVAGDEGGMAAIQRGMWQEAPKEILFDPRESAVKIGLWPESATIMDVRRYSNYPHRSQGESVPDNDMRWVLNYYYRHEPFTGVSRTHETMLFFHGPEVTTGQVDSVAADFNSQPLVYAGWPLYRKTEVTMPLADADSQAFTRFNAAHDNVFSWWLYHQKCYGWYGFWDFGDVMHKFRTGYGHIVQAEDLGGASVSPSLKLQDLGCRVEQDYFTQNDWTYDNGRWGWSNTEGLLNLSFGLQYLRTGRRELFFFMEAYARHARDVDVRHGGMWFGKGTRHGVQHWSDGNHEERQTTFTEYRYHYLLTGEARTREWSRELTERWYMSTASITSATHGGRSYGLLFNWEITGDQRVGDVLKKFMHIMAQPQGIAAKPVVMFPQVALIGALNGMNSDDFFFHSFGAMHAVLDYYYITQDARVRDAIIAMAAAAGDPDGETRKALAFAARHAPDAQKYRDIIGEYALGKGFDFVYRQVPANPEHWSGPTAFLTGNVSGGMFWLSSALYVLGALEREPELTPEKVKALAEMESGKRQPEPRAPRESWQTEYDDRPELKEYLRDRVGY